VAEEVGADEGIVGRGERDRAEDAAATWGQLVRVSSEDGLTAPTLSLEKQACVVMRRIPAQLRQRVAHGRRTALEDVW
jgi:hypothetical protein